MDAILAWGLPDPVTRGVAEEGGYRINGSRSFASGLRHATWHGACRPVYESGGKTRRVQHGKGIMRMKLVPAGSAGNRTDIMP